MPRSVFRPQRRYYKRLRRPKTADQRIINRRHVIRRVAGRNKRRVRSDRLRDRIVSTRFRLSLILRLSLMSLRNILMDCDGFLGSSNSSKARIYLFIYFLKTFVNSLYFVSRHENSHDRWHGVKLQTKKYFSMNTRVKGRFFFLLNEVLRLDSLSFQSWDFCVKRFLFLSHVKILVGDHRITC